MKTKLTLKFLAIFVFIFAVSVLFSSLRGNAADRVKTADCGILFCVYNDDGTPAVGHTVYIYDSGGNVIATGVTNSNGCFTPRNLFADGKTYCACDMSVPCLHNCVRFTVDCTNPYVTFPSCNPSPGCN